ncbi:hypothetical protein CIB48_g11547, partial [Xylaria polymorpha]
SPPAAEPVYGQQFDPWNSSSTGHQQAENRLGVSTGWRTSRNRKLMGQFTGGAGGGKRISDTAGEGAQHWDHQAKAVITPEVRSRARCSVLDMLAKPGAMKPSSSSSASAPPVAPAPAAASTSTSSEFRKAKSRSSSPSEMTAEECLMARRREEDAAREQAKQPRKIFDGVVVYLNGSTHPLISDHKLKHVLAENGASMSSHLGRRKWVLESIKAGRRLPEARFADLKVASKGQQSVYGLYSNHKDKTSARVDEFQPPPSGQA